MNKNDNKINNIPNIHENNEINVDNFNININDNFNLLSNISSENEDKNKKYTNNIDDNIILNNINKEDE